MIFGLEWSFILELLLLGSATGFMAGLLGVGGGMLLVPFITLLLSLQGIAPHYIGKMAVATSLATICFTSLASVRAHQQRGAVRWDLVRLLAPGIVIGSLVGAQIAKALPSPALALLFAVFAAFSATQMLLGRKPTAANRLPGSTGMVAAGGVIGTLSALVGAGGGFISVPFMTWGNVPMHNTVATSAALGFPIALAGTIGYIVAGWSVHDMPASTLGFIYLPALAAIALASVLFAPLGARAAHGLQRQHLQRVFAGLLCVLSGYMFYRGIAG